MLRNFDEFQYGLILVLKHELDEVDISVILGMSSWMDLILISGASVAERANTSIVQSVAPELDPQRRHGFFLN